VVGEIVGRHDELEALRAFLASPRKEPGALVLEGDAGIGKSTLWRAAVGDATSQGVRVLSSRPAEAERGLPFAGLGDLFEPVLDDVLPSLPRPRRTALGIALLLEDGAGPLDPRALGVAVRNALEVLAEDGPLVVAVDDVQWLDPSSAAGLAFALRRLHAGVAVLLARRVGEGLDPSPVEDALGGDLAQHLRLGPLSVGAIQLLLRNQLDRVFPRPTLLRIHEASGGNPFYALELARTLGPNVDPTQPLPVPETLDELVGARLAGLPGATRDALVLGSALGTVPVKLLQAAGVADDALEPAVAARVIELQDGAVRFTHPLLSSVLYQGLSGAERRRAHRVLADVVVDPLEQARHRALATEEPDPEVAAALDEAAALAKARGASAVAAELAEHALRLTRVDAPADEHRRSIAAGRAHLAAGEVDRARTLGRALDALDPEGDRRVDALVFLSEAELGHLRARIALRREALQAASGRPELQQLLHQKLAIEVRFFEGRSAAEVHARSALDLAESLGDDALRAAALAVFALLRFIGGEPEARGLSEEARALASVTGDEQRLDAGFCLAHILVWSGELEAARELLEELDRSLGERDERVSAQASWFLSLVELGAGRIDLAGYHAERAKELGALYGRGENEDPHSYLPVALVAAQRGDLAGARDLAGLGQALAERQGALLPGLLAVPGLADLWAGEPAAAVRHFDLADRTADRAGWQEPGLRWWRADHVEALVELGRLDDAVSLVGPWEEAASRVRRPWVLAQAKRCRGLVAAAEGDVDDAQTLLDEAVRAHELLGDRLGHARALLALGIVARRARQKRASREAIEQALAIFDECGAEGWADRARAELGRISGRTREDGLTPAEQRVAALVAEGRTNREVAAALVLGERTVETHLTHIYAKLGVRSRTELARSFESRG
jgi:DNA-binding CsgD family transcriptional regulator